MNPLNTLISLTLFVITCWSGVLAAQPVQIPPTTWERERVLEMDVDELPLSNPSVRWLRKYVGYGNHMNSDVERLVLEDPFVLPQILMGRPTIRAELETFLASKGLRLAMTEEELELYVKFGIAPQITERSDIRVTGLPSKLTRPFVKAGFKTIGQIRQLSDEDILALRGLGATSVIQIRDFFAIFDTDPRAICESKL